MSDDGFTRHLIMALPVIILQSRIYSSMTFKLIFETFKKNFF